MKKILIIVNAVVYNRGSEALIRGLSKICKEKYPKSEITLVSSEDNFGEWLQIENIDLYKNKLDYKSKSLKRYISSILKRLGLYTLVNNFRYTKLKKIAKEQDIIIIIGADNYDISYNMQEDLKRLNMYLRKNTSSKMILYDCSIDKRDLTETLKSDLNNFDVITVRETISEENIKSLNKNIKLNLYPDPAFVMEKEKVELPDIFNNSKVVGINVSNLITNSKYGSNAEKILMAYKNMIKYILDNTKMNIVLLPHVMNNADLSTLKVLYKDYEENSRVYLVDNEKLNAKQLKYIISNCELFIGARTHATIAAYSSIVPTLVLGYSVKSKGIAKDIFSTYENYVLPVAELDSEDYLVDGFKWLYENQNKIRSVLKEKMPKYIEEAKRINEIL